jgi:hypothetical protein
MTPVLTLADGLLCETGGGATGAGADVFAEGVVFVVAGDWAAGDWAAGDWAGTDVCGGLTVTV